MYPKPIDLLNQTLQLLKLKISLIFVVIFIPTLATITITQIYLALFHPNFSSPNTTLASVLRPEFFIFTLISLFIGLWSQSALFYTVVRLRQEITPFQVFKNSLTYLPRQLLLNIFTVLSVFVGLILLIIPGFFLGLIFSLSNYILYAEDLSPFQAMSKSWKYLRGHLRQYFLRTVTFFLASFIILFMVSIITAIANNNLVSSVGDVIANSIVTAFSAIYFYLNYLYLKSLLGK